MGKKGENIYKRKDGRWEARYVRGYKPDGAIRYGYCYGKTYYEAKEKVNRAKAAIINHLPFQETGKRKRFATYCEEWLRLKRSSVKESTYVKYSTMLEKHIRPRLGRYYVETFSEILVEQFSYDLLHEMHLSPKTVRDILALLHSVLKYAAKQNPSMPSVEIVYPKEDRKEIRVLSWEEQQRFIQYLFEEMDACKFGVMLDLMTGIRIGEICALRWSDISLCNRTVTVRQTMQRLKDTSDLKGRKTKIVVSDPKSSMSARIIPLSDSMTALCRKCKVGNSSAYVLTGNEKHYMEPRTLQYRLEKYTTDCGLCGVHFHTLRHSFATRCVEAGFEIKSLSEILGHSSPKITLERYVHSSLELKRENMEKLDRIQKYTPSEFAVEI